MKTDLQQTKRKPEGGNGYGEEQYGHDWESAERQNQAGEKNSSETDGEGVQDYREEQPLRETKKGRQPRENREDERRPQERKSQDPDREVEAMVLSLHQILGQMLTLWDLGWTPHQLECPRN